MKLDYDELKYIVKELKIIDEKRGEKFKEDYDDYETRQELLPKLIKELHKRMIENVEEANRKLYEKRR